MSTRNIKGSLEYRAGKSAHVALYIQGTGLNVAIGVKREDAADIVTAVNAHDELVATLADLVRAVGIGPGRYQDSALDAARAALAKVAA